MSGLQVQGGQGGLNTELPRVKACLFVRNFFYALK